jgi:hypothetical protein
MVREKPTNYPWTFEMKVEDPDGHILRFESEPKQEAVEFEAAG